MRLYGIVLYVKLYLLVCLECQVLKLTPCGPDGFFEVVEGSLTNEMFCSGLTKTDTVTWSTVYGASTAPIKLGVCEPLPKSCSFIGQSYINFTRNSDETSTGSIDISHPLPDLDYALLFPLKALWCDNGSTPEVPTLDHVSNNCSVDYIHLPEVKSCVVRYAVEDDSLRLVGSCDISKVFSAGHRYSCQLFHTSNTTDIPVSPVVNMTTQEIPGEKNVSGKCVFNELLPAGSGYTVQMNPGRIRIDAIIDYDSCFCYGKCQPNTAVIVGSSVGGGILFILAIIASFFAGRYSVKTNEQIKPTLKPKPSGFSDEGGYDTIHDSNTDSFIRESKEIPPERGGYLHAIPEAGTNISTTDEP